MTTPAAPPDLDGVRALLRPRMAEIPTILAQWSKGEGPLADVPLVDPGEVAPRSFEQLAGTVRVASATSSLVTVGGLLEIPDGGGLLVTAMALNPHDLSGTPDVVRSRQVLAEVGARSEGLLVEVAVLLGTLGDGAGPAVGVGVVRPLVLADPAAFPHDDDPTPYGADLVDAARQAVVEDRDVIADLGGRPLDPLPADLARIWAPLFAVARAATAGLAARGAAGGSSS